MRALLILGAVALVAMAAAIWWVERDVPEDSLGQVSLPEPGAASGSDLVPESANPMAVQRRLEAQAASKVPSTEPTPEEPAPPEPDPFQEITMPMSEIAAMAEAGDVRAAEEMVLRIELCQLPDLRDREAVAAELDQARTTHVIFGTYIHDRDELEAELAEIEFLVETCAEWHDPEGVLLAEWRDRAAEMGSVGQSYLLFDPPGDGPIDASEFRRLSRNVSQSCTAKDFGTLAIAAAALDDQPMIFAAESMRQSLSDSDRTGDPQHMSGALYGADLIRADELLSAFEAACSGA